MSASCLPDGSIRLQEPKADTHVPKGLWWQLPNKEISPITASAFLLSLARFVTRDASEAYIKFKLFISFSLASLHPWCCYPEALRDSTLYASDFCPCLIFYSSEVFWRRDFCLWQLGLSSKWIVLCFCRDLEPWPIKQRQNSILNYSL